MPNTNLKVGILYFGKRGGGLDLAKELFNAGLEAGVHTELILRPLTSNSTPISNLNFVRWFIERRRLINFAKKELELVVIAMASPWDLGIGNRLRKRGIQVNRLIHDATPHPGEIFPPIFWTRKLLKDADLVIALSDYVQKELIRHYPETTTPIIRTALPIVDETKIDNDPIITNPYLLLIGRGRRYKGLDLLKEAFLQLPSSSLKLVVAGEGHMLDDTDQIIELNKWLSKGEIENLIYYSEVVIFPYIEASQSGLIPIAISCNKKIVVTPVGGLVEQISKYSNGYVSEDVSKDELAKAITNSLASDIKARSSFDGVNRLEFFEACTRMMDTGAPSK